MQEAILKKITITATETGIDETTSKVDKLAKSEVELSKAEKDRAAVEAAVARQRVEFNRVAQQQLGIMKDFNAQAKLMSAANDNVAQSHSHLGDVLRVGTKTAIDHAASWLATAGAVGAAALVFRSLLSVLGPLILVYKAVAGAVGLATEAWRLGGEELAKFRKIAADAAAVDLSTDYFQRITKAATSAKIPVDALTETFKNLQKVTAEKLGGSDFEKTLDKLTAAGNFKGNTGVAQLAQANTLEEKAKALFGPGGLVDQAFAKGERLAALNLTSTFASPAVQDALTKNSDALSDMFAAAEKISKTEIVSDKDIGNALELERRYDAAVKILETRWHPIQNLLTQAGIQMHSNWVSIVETIASAVDAATKLVNKLMEVPSSVWNSIQNGANAVGKFAVENFTTPESRRAAEVQHGISSDPNDLAAASSATLYAAAVDKLRAGLQNQYEQQRKVNEANAIAQKTLGDASKATESATKATTEQANAYDRAVDSVERHIARMEADAKSVGLGVAAREELRAKATLTTAALQAGIPVTAAMSAEIEKLAKAAGAAALDLEKAKVAADIKFQSDTLFLSQEDVKIAQQLKGLFPDIATALASPEAAAMRFNDQVKEIKQIAEQLAATFANDFVQGVMSGKSAMESLTASVSSLGKSLTTAGINNIVKDPTSIVGYIETGIGLLAQAFGASGESDERLRKAQEQWKPMAEEVAVFNEAPRFTSARKPEVTGNEKSETVETPMQSPQFRQNAETDGDKERQVPAGKEDRYDGNQCLAAA